MPTARPSTAIAQTAAACLGVEKRQEVTSRPLHHQQEEEAIEAIGGAEAATHGEMTPLGFGRWSSAAAEEDVFADLGSGLGRWPVSQAAREVRGEGGRLSSTRYRGTRLRRRRAKLPHPRNLSNSFTAIVPMPTCGAPRCTTRR